jgi:arylsulfatase A-like enzyme
MAKSISGSMLAAATAFFAFAPASQHDIAHAADKPNILFVIMDDVGIDQMKLFGFGGTPAAKTPNLALIAAHGVKFTNVWSMPECSPSRAAFFTGRYPARTGVESAIVTPHLPQAHVSQYEATLPRVLTKAGYVSALIGKYHLGDDPDPAGSCAPARRGFHFFSGMQFGSPTPIDTTAGGGDPTGGQTCGYFQTTSPGACYTLKSDGTTKCQTIDATNADPNTSPSRTCLQNGGLFRPSTACGDSVPTTADFSNNNAYYVWPRQRMIGPRSPDWAGSASCAPTQNRKYMDTKEADAAPNWWNKQTGPRMMTLSFGGMHAPFQKSPTSTVPDPKDKTVDCSAAEADRGMLNNILEALDVEVGRVIADIGLGTLDSQGRTLTSLHLDNTVVIVVGDNGSLSGTVRALDGFSPPRSKASVYQTGVWVPLIVAGPIVAQPGRDVDALINVTDLFQLFGDIAGVSVKNIVPPSHTLDSKPMMPYLRAPDAPPVRVTNFTQAGVGALTPVPEDRSWPCQVQTQCTDTILYAKGLCESNGGTWYGPGGKTQVSSCCAVVAANSSVTIIPPAAYATRNKTYKLVELENTDCTAPLSADDPKLFPWQEYKTKAKREFYDISRSKTNPTGMDIANRDMLKDCPEGQDPKTCLPKALRADYNQLSNAMAAVRTSGDTQASCRALGDGNQDMRITQRDLDEWKRYNGTGPSQYDINMDGLTDTADRDIIKANLNTDCMNICDRADLDRNGVVDAKDMALLVAQTGKCDEVLCGGDLDGNNQVNRRDIKLMQDAQNSCSVPRAPKVRGARR